MDYLRDWAFDLNTKEHKTKMEIVDYFKTKGLNYWGTPIPKRYYEKYPKEYIGEKMASRQQNV